jgi:hypothetical protein
MKHKNKKVVSRGNRTHHILTADVNLNHYATASCDFVESKLYKTQHSWLRRWEGDRKARMMAA